MPHRYHQEPNILTSGTTTSRPQLFHAIKEKLKKGYSFPDFKADFMASLVVAMVAIPLGMALAIASGVAPQNGLYTVIIAGIVVAFLGGSRFQVTGPTAAFVVILAPIAHKYGLGGLLTAGLMSGFILLAMGLGRMGKLIQFIPYPVVTGFTSGIAVVIATLQLKDFFGLKISNMPEGFLEKVITMAKSTSTVSWPESAVGLATLLLLLLWPKINKRIPAPLVALGLISVITAILKSKYPGLVIDTIGTRFSYTINNMTGHGIPQTVPHFTFPWAHGTESFSITLQSIEALIPSAFAIAMLGAVESLLSAVVADGISQTKHDPDSELMALGIGNIICPFFGGVAATGAIARTATNIRFGAKSPLSSILHGLITLVVILLFAPYVSYLPMAGLSALLLLVSYNMAEIRHFTRILKVGPKSDATVLFICFLLTVSFDMVIGVTTGVLLAALLFIKKMASATSTQILDNKAGTHHYQVPSDVLLYDINGPLFFGAAETAMEAIDTIKDNVKVVFLLMEDVPVMDVTGLVALESTVEDLVVHKRSVYLIGVKSQPKELILRSGTISKKVFFYRTVEDALDHYKDKQIPNK